MRYTQLCRRDRDLVEFSYPLSTQKFTARPVQRLRIDITLQGKDAIKSVFCPSDDARIDRVGDHEARITLERRDIVPTNDFRLVYTLRDGAIGASLISYRPSTGDDGYFLLLASPEVKAAEAKAQPKTVIFVLDRSGSMAGKKIEQARKALKSVLNNLREDDLFNIVVYDDRVESFMPELERYSIRSRELAERYVDNIREGGSTNIDSALKTALGMIHDDARASCVLFLTDGLPTAGETQELKIAENARHANTRRARVFCFGVGFDVNSRLLDRLSGGNSGTSEYVKPDEDIEAHVGRFYAKMTSPVLAGPRVDLANIDVNRSYPSELPDLFEGGQIVWVGRYRQSGRTAIKITGKVNGELRSFEFPAELEDSNKGSTHDYIERIWATRRVGYLIDQIDLSGQNRELVDELVSLSTRYGILTPYTAFLADERVPLHAAMENRQRTRENLDSLQAVSGGFAVAQRDLKQAYMRAEKADQPGMGRMGGMGAMMGGMAAMMGGMAASQNGQAALSYGRKMSEQLARDGQNLAPPSAPLGGTRARLYRNAGAAPAQQPTTAMPAVEAQLVNQQDADRGVQTKLRQIGSKTFYFKENRWIDSAVLPEEDAKARRVRQFSDEFFNLARSQEAELNQYLTFTEPVTIKLAGIVYRIDPAGATP
jgi:Ca-activated chloride channel family protein